MKTAAYVLLCSTLLVAGQVLVKQGLNAMGGFDLSLSSPWTGLAKIFTSGYIWLGGLVTLVSGLVWMSILSKRELSLVYPLISLSYVVALACSAVILKEQVSPLRWLGVGVICLGVYMVSKS
jgi:uncharacterized membrane protein